jgi:hypothetical protein
MKGICEVCRIETTYSKNRCYEHEHYQETCLSGYYCPRCSHKEFWKFYFYDEWKYKCKYCEYETILDGLEEIEKGTKMTNEVEYLKQVLNKLAEYQLAEWELDKSNSIMTNKKIKEAFLAVSQAIEKLESI